MLVTIIVDALHALEWKANRMEFFYSRKIGLWTEFTLMSECKIFFFNLILYPDDKKKINYLISNTIT
jgi:hypothetical protein